MDYLFAIICIVILVVILLALMFLGKKKDGDDGVLSEPKPPIDSVFPTYSKDVTAGYSSNDSASYPSTDVSEPVEQAPIEDVSDETQG